MARDRSGSRGRAEAKGAAANQASATRSRGKEGAMTALQLQFALHPMIHGMFRQKSAEKCRSVGVERTGPRPPKAEATGSNPVGCTSFPPFLGDSAPPRSRYRSRYPVLCVVRSWIVSTSPATPA